MCAVFIPQGCHISLRPLFYIERSVITWRLTVA
nr:MAG TPA: hypothetical protein [Caudoviricetes sp.]DAG25313.1 MAG TPA: hypothetical protein [Caudoviricetes sp.]